MRKTWVLTCLAACCAAIAAFISIGGTDEAKVLTVQDALDPTASVIAPYAGSSIERLTPYQLGQRLPGLEGMAFVFSTQARAYQKGSGSLGYAPLYSATAVIAVNRGSDLREPVKGWRTLLSSGAVVLIPHHGTEGGRLAAIALARGLGAREGDLGPATEAFALLQSQGRLNRQDVYRSADYWAMYPPDRLTEHDAIILWDYQAAMLSPDEWEIVVPEEGSLSVDCGFVYGGSLKAREKLLPVRDFLLSDKGRQALADAGFSPPAQPPDLSGWDAARLAYNPGFRRAVLSAKLYGPASVQERLILQSAVLLLFCFAAQRTLRRLPRGIYRTTSLYCLLLVMLWMLVSVLKTISLHYDPSRYLWFSTYLPRHFLPVFWVCMCRINRSGQLPPRKALTALLITAAVLTALVFSNDIHRLVFVYLNTSSSTWASQYTNGWGYYVSSAWSFCLIVAGMALLLHKNRTRQQNRQIVYAFTLFFILLGYQALYIAGVKYVLDFDIPTTVAFFVLVFILAAQRERFMGATCFQELAVCHLDLRRFGHRGVQQ